MAVLLITFQCNAETSKPDKAFYEFLGIYRWVKLYGSNYAITADEPAKAVWQKLKAQIDTENYR